MDTEEKDNVEVEVQEEATPEQDEMLDLIDSTPDQSEVFAEEEDEVEGEEAAEDTSSEDEDESQEAGKEEVETDETEETEETEEVSEVEQLRETAEALRRRLAELAGPTLVEQLGTTPKATETLKESEPTTEQPTEPSKPAVTVQGSPADPVEFVKDSAELIQLFRSPEKFNAILNQAVDYGRQLAYRDIPQLTREALQQQANIKAASDAFYAENPELKDYDRLVSHTFTELQAKDPTKTVAELLSETAVQVKSVLQLNETAKKVERKRAAAQPNKSFAPTRGQRRNATKPDELTKDMQDILEV